MSLFSRTRLKRAVQECLSLLQKISQELLPDSHPEQGRYERDFMDAVNNYDDARVNKLIDESFQYYCDESNILTGLEKYCQKFGITADFFSISNEEMIQSIAGHKEKIAQRLKKEGVIDKVKLYFTAPFFLSRTANDASKQTNNSIPIFYLLGGLLVIAVIVCVLLHTVSSKRDNREGKKQTQIGSNDRDLLNLICDLAEVLKLTELT